MDITIEGLGYSVVNEHNKKETLHLLRDVTGYFKRGEMAALMGPSGSGKTTMLDLLAGRKTVGKMEGTVLFSGSKPTRNFLRRYTGYVEQFDTLLPILSVEEMLMYTAELKRPRSVPLAEKQQAVEEILDKLALQDCRHVKIGDALHKGVSGGQAKRTNIGVSLITSPRVLFLDEPTSGLDSFTANEVMSVVQGLAAAGVTIVSTVHTPTAYAFSLFDSLLMLVRGRVVYFGPTGSACITHIKSISTTLHFQPSKQQRSGTSLLQHGKDTNDLDIEVASDRHAKGLVGAQHRMDESMASMNPAEWVMDVFTQADRQGKGDDFADAYNASELNLANLQQAAQLASSHTDLPAHVTKELSARSETVTPWWWGLKTLIKYRTSHNYKDQTFLGARLGDKILMGLIMMTLYLGLGDYFHPDNYPNMAALLSLYAIMPAFAAVAYIPSITLERSLFYRERNDGLYTTFTSLAGKLFEEVAINAFIAVPMTAAAFYVIKLQGSYGYFYCMYLATLCLGVALGYFYAAVCPNMDVANAALPAYASTLLYFSGFLITLDSMPAWWKWYAYINPIRYSWTGLMVNQFEHNDPQWVAGKTFLEFYSLDGQNKWANLGFVCCFTAFFLSCSWAALNYLNFQKR